MAEPLADAIEAGLRGEDTSRIEGEAFGREREVLVLPALRDGKSVSLVSGDMHLMVPRATAKRAMKELRHASEQARVPERMPEVRLADHPESVDAIVSLETFFAEQDGLPVCRIAPDHAAYAGSPANAH